MKLDLSLRKHIFLILLINILLDNIEFLNAWCKELCPPMLHNSHTHIETDGLFEQLHLFGLDTLGAD
jgi:hypothetical protein